MIIECLGPPASGKTTLAVALAERLRQGGLDVQLRLSSRPGEGFLGRMEEGSRALLSPLGTMARRLLRPAYELTVAAVRSFADRADGHCSDALARGLARGQILRFLRMKQYLIRLENAWSQATRKEAICIFDQGYLQVIATIMLHRPDLGDAELMTLIEAAPKSDLVIFVDTPVDEIERRLGQRRRKLGRLGWLFEEELGAIRRQAEAAAHLKELLSQSGRRILAVQCADEALVESFVGGMERTISHPSLSCEAAAG